MKIGLLLVLVLVVSLLTVDGWLFRRRRRSVRNRCGGWWWRRHKCTSTMCNDPSRGKPYYFGTTNLWCMAKKGKRASHPTRPTLKTIHRWILYDGYYFERLRNADVYNYGYSTDMNKCRTSRESRPAGYSKLGVDCIKRCTRKYRRQFGRYRLLRNNCHHFANRMSNILCTRSTCPSWCA